MTRDELRKAIVEAIEAAVPGVNVRALKGAEDIREALDIDSFDVLQVAVKIKERLGVDVPESDMPRILTIDGGVAYLQARLGG